MKKLFILILSSFVIGSFGCASNKVAKTETSVSYTKRNKVVTTTQYNKRGKIVKKTTTTTKEKK